MKKSLIITGSFLFAFGIGFAALFYFAPDWLSSLPWTSSISEKWQEMSLDPKDYFVNQSWALTKAKDGYDGKLELLLDKKLKDEKDPSKMIERVGGEDIDDPKSGHWKIAAIQLCGTDAKTKDVKILFDAVAFVQDRIDLYGDGRPVFRINNFYRTDTNSSTYTDLIEVRDGKLVKIAGLSEDFNPHLRIVDDWKLVPSRSGKGMDILSLWLIQPDNDKENVDVTYTRTFFNGHEWASKSKEVTVDGTYESVGDKKITEAEFPK